MPDLGEIYPLGGSADRLGLVDPVTGESLPAAMLLYCGRTLLEGLIRDLQVLDLFLPCVENYFLPLMLNDRNELLSLLHLDNGFQHICMCLNYIIEFFYHCKAREFLYFKLYGKQCITPVAIMTSSAKNNHEHITLLCERHTWFGRGQSRFQLFEQV